MAPESAAHQPLQGCLCAGDRGQSPNPAERPRARDREFHRRPLEEDAGQTCPRSLGIGTGGRGSSRFCQEHRGLRWRVSQGLGPRPAPPRGPRSRFGARTGDCRRSSFAGNRHRYALTGFPCHTTVRTGPYTAVQKVELNSPAGLSVAESSKRELDACGRSPGFTLAPATKHPKGLAVPRPREHDSYSPLLPFGPSVSTTYYALC
jgi:hypothetical protein